MDVRTGSQYHLQQAVSALNHRHQTRIALERKKTSLLYPVSTRARRGRGHLPHGFSAVYRCYTRGDNADRCYFVFITHTIFSRPCRNSWVSRAVVIGKNLGARR